MLRLNGLLYEKILAHLLGELRQGRLRAGERLPSEQELARSFAVSRITSRKALDLLARAGVVERSRGRGTFVARQLPDLNRVSQELGLLSETPLTAVAPTLGLILPDFSEGYGLQLVYAVEETCAEDGAHLILKRTYGRREVEEAAIAALRQRADGLVVFPVHGEHYNPVLLQAVLDGFPLVLVDRYLPGIPAPAVCTDNRRAAGVLTRHLLELGHRHIAFLSPPVEHTSSLEERLDGFITALVEAGLTADPRYYLQDLLSTLPTQFDSAHIHQDQARLRRFLNDFPEVTAFFVAEYNLALELYQLLGALGRRVPEDCSIVCFDSPGDPLQKPLFTHVRQDQQAMGRKAVEQVLARLEGQTPPLLTHVEFTLVVGRSSAQPPGC